MLNPATLLLVLVVFTTVTTVLLVVAALPSDALAEQRLWAQGNVAASAGFAVGAWTDAHVLVHAGLSYGLIGLGVALVLRGLKRFCGSDLSAAAVLAIAFGAFVLPAYFAWIQPDKGARLIVSGFYLAALSAWGAAILLRSLQDGSRSGMWACVAGFAMLAVLLLLRALYLLLEPVARFDPARIEALAGISVLAAAVAQVMIAFGLIMLVSHRHADRLNRLRQLDGLTGVLNRVGMEAMARRVLARAAPGRQAVAVVMVDADLFKAINDRHGHLAGDRVLVHLAGILAAQVRPGDLVIRYGGEEFVLLLDGSDLAAAGAVAERLRALIEAGSVSQTGGDIRYTVSIGVACSSIAGYALETLLARADAALYRAKQRGRNQVCLDEDAQAPR